MPAANVTDADAVAEVLRGNREMFEVIVRRYNQQLYRIGLGYLRNRVQVEDAMQNAYVSAFLHLRSFQAGAKLSTWLTRIMINECLMLLRRDRARPTEALDPRLQDEPATDPAAFDELHMSEIKTLLEAAVSALPPNYRAVYMLREVQQLSTLEAAETLGISAESVKVLLHRARARIKDYLLDSAAGIELFTYPAQYCDPMTDRVMRIVLRLGVPA